jgi:uncharacterized protein
MAAGLVRHNWPLMGPDYAELQKVLANSRALTDAPEAHGTLAGALCAAADYTLADWLAELYADGHADPDSTAALRVIFDATRAELASDQMAFQALLPDDDEPIAARAEALGQWCQGFLYGLGTQPIPEPDQLPQDAGEVVRDMTALTQVAADSEESDESNEQAYAELVEFVRVGAQLLFDELAPWRGNARETAAPSTPLH